MHLAAETEPRIIVGAHDAGFGLAQRGQHFLGIVADARNDTHTGDDDTAHDGLSDASLQAWRRRVETEPTRRSDACIDSLAVRLEKPVGDAEIELAQDDALQD